MCAEWVQYTMGARRIQYTPLRCRSYVFLAVFCTNIVSVFQGCGTENERQFLVVSCGFFVNCRVREEPQLLLSTEGTENTFFLRRAARNRLSMPLDGMRRMGARSETGVGRHPAELGSGLSKGAGGVCGERGGAFGCR